MTTAERLRQEGRQETRQSLAKALALLLSATFGELTEGFRSRIESASAEEFDRWIDRVRAAAPLEDVFADA